MKRVLLFILAVSCLFCEHVLSMDLKNKIIGGCGGIGVLAFGYFAIKNSRYQKHLQAEKSENKALLEKFDKLEQGQGVNNKGILESIYFQLCPKDSIKDFNKYFNNNDDFNYPRIVDGLIPKIQSLRDMINKHQNIVGEANTQWKQWAYGFGCFGGFALISLAYFNQQYRWV